MLEYIILIADRGAVSFCHYENEAYNAGVSEMISLDALTSIVNYTKDHDIILNVLLGQNPLPEKHLCVLDNVKHIKFIPYQLHTIFPDAVLVFDWKDGEQVSYEIEKRIENIIIRLRGRELPDLRKVVRNFIEGTQRINLVLKDVQELTELNLIEYEHQLDGVASLIFHQYLDGKSIELSVVSDRLLLNKMNNCDAGIKHVTFAPNGKFYICPGFYHSNPQNDIGSLETGIKILNKELLQLDHAPICINCDAYQCKRCVYLNQMTTREMNTPSRQQCVLSHIERNASRHLIRRLKPALQNFHELSDIPELDFLDPLDSIQDKKPYNKIELYRICKGDI